MAGAFIEVDNGPGGTPARFAEPSEIIAARELGEVPDALAALDRVLAGGAWIAGFAGYELGYAFEPRLARLLPPGRRLPLTAISQPAPAKLNLPAMATCTKMALNTAKTKWPATRTLRRNN